MPSLRHPEAHRHQARSKPIPAQPGPVARSLGHLWAACDPPVLRSAAGKYLSIGPECHPLPSLCHVWEAIIAVGAAGHDCVYSLGNGRQVGRHGTGDALTDHARLDGTSRMSTVSRPCCISTLIAVAGSCAAMTSEATPPWKVRAALANQPWFSDPNFPLDDSHFPFPGSKDDLDVDARMGKHIDPCIDAE